MTLKTVGIEQIRVPAGEFSAVRIEARSAMVLNSGADAGSIAVLLTYWYSPELTRTIKISKRQIATLSHINYEDVFELTAYHKGQ